MDKDRLIEQLDKFQSKAFCVYTEEQAQSIFDKISPYIHWEYLNKIRTEWSHVKLNHGKFQARLELKMVIDEYKTYLKTVEVVY